MAASVLSVYKPVGLTPLEALNTLRISRPELQNEVLAYAGRLDPMAEGLILVLVGDECKKRDVYQMLPKSYEVTIVFGITTDTYDPLGIPTHISQVSLDTVTIHLDSVLSKHVGTHKQQYPPYSSARVQGKPLFHWARTGKLHTITIPEKKIELTTIKKLSEGTLPASELLLQIQQKIHLVTGDFRQQEILNQWNDQLPKYSSFPFVTIQVDSSHGAYMRSLAHDIGAQLGVGAIAFHIKRLSVGEYTLDQAIRI